MSRVLSILLLSSGLAGAAQLSTSTATIRTQFGAQADFFVFYVGGQPGVYTNSVCSTIPQATITGLIQGRTYYFTASAFVRAKETGKAVEVSKTVPVKTVAVTPLSITNAVANPF